MSLVNHADLAQHLRDTARNQLASVFLICGEEYLCKSAFDLVLDALLPGAQRKLNLESFDGGDDIVGDALACINTYSLIPGSKVVAIRDVRLFYSQQDHAKILEKTQAAFKAGRLEKAAKRFVGLLALLNLTYDDVGPATRAQALKRETHQAEDWEWLDRILDFCSENRLAIPAGQNVPDLMQAAIEKGFPPRHYLVMTTDVFDRRRSLYKCIQEKGLIVDCSVPKGSRQADKVAQDALLENAMQTVLKRARKAVEPEARRLLHEMTGFDLPTFTHNLEKLVDYVGTRGQITVTDVETAIRRTKKDPIFAFTNAIADRSTAKALFFLNSLLDDDMHPLQILAALTNQVRKLIVARDFEDSDKGREWHAGMTYRQFQTRIIPAIEAYDRLLLANLEAWVQDLSEPAAADEERAAEKRADVKAKATSDLMLAKNPKNAYPIYQTLLKAGNFSLSELLATLAWLSQVDLVMKSTGRNPKIVLEEVVMRICGLENHL